MPPEASKVDALVVGAGIAGITAARCLQERGCRTAVVEAEAIPGGRVRTETWEGCRVELGAVYMTRRYEELVRTLDALEVRGELVPLRNAFRTGVRRGERWSYVDYGQTANLLARTRDFARFSLLPWRDRASLAKLMPPMARVVARRMRFFDVASAASIDAGRLVDVVSPDAARYFVSPLIEVFFGYELEQIAMPVVALAADAPGRALTLRAGMGTLARTLAGGLDVRYAQRVTRLEIEGPAGPVSITASGGSGEVVYRAQGAVIATASDAARELWPGAPDGTRRFLESTAYSDSYLVFLRTKERFQKVDRSGKELYMEVVPGGAALQAILFLNSVAPDGGLVAATATPAARRSLDDEALAARLESEAVELHPQLRDQVVARRAVRTPRVVPLFPAGRARELQAFRSRLAAGPVQLAGDYLYGPCMESAAQAGRAAAERLHAHIRPNGTAPAPRGLLGGRRRARQAPPSRP